MAHEITATDGLLLHKSRAWHGLGTVIDQTLTATESLKLAGLGWRVDQYPLTGSGPEGDRLAIDSHVANVRSDTKESLGVVGSGYSPIQNTKLAEIADSLAEGGDVVKIESAGSIRGGKKLWFLLKGESFSVRGKDEINPYILLANAHDGTMALRAIPTSVRVVCSNTLHMSLGGTKSVGYTFRHTSGVQIKAEEIKSALGLYGRALDHTKGQIEILSHKEVNREQVQAFFLEAFTRDFGAIPANPKTDAENTQRDRAMEAHRHFSRRWDRERDIAGTTAWNAFNAYSGFVQHERRIRVADDRKAEARVEYRLMGEDADRTSATFAQALALV